MNEPQANLSFLFIITVEIHPFLPQPGLKKFCEEKGKFFETLWQYQI